MHDASDIANIVVKTTPAGIPVRIGDLGTRAIVGEARLHHRARQRTSPPFCSTSIASRTATPCRWPTKFTPKIDSIRKTLPQGVTLTPFYDQSELVKDSIKSVRDAILIGLVLAAIILVLFLRDWGSSIVAGLVIPATIAVTFIALRVLSESFNLMTLGRSGRRRRIGDRRRHRGGGEHRHASRCRPKPRRGDSQRHARDPRPTGWVYPDADRGISAADFHHRRHRNILPRPGRDGGHGAAHLAGAGAHLDADAEPLLSEEAARSESAYRKGHRGCWAGSFAFTGACCELALERPWATAIFCVLLIGASYFCYNALGSRSAARDGRRRFHSGLHRARRFLAGRYGPPAEPGAKDTSGHAGSREHIPAHRTATRTGHRHRSQYRRFYRPAQTQVVRAAIDEVIADVRKRVTTEVPTLDVEFVQLLQDMIGDLTSAPEPVVIKMFSENADLLKQWGPRVGDAIKKIHGVVDIQNGIENTISGPAMEFHVDPTVAARSGFTPDEVELDTSAILQGEPAAAPVVVNGRAYTIRVRFPEYTRTSVEAIRNTLLSSQSGSRATLGSLATVEELPGQTEIRRENLQRMLAVTARLEGLNLGDGNRSRAENGRAI